MVAFVVFLRIGLDVFDWGGLVEKVLAKGFTVIVAVSLTYMVLKFIDLVMGYWHQRTRADADRAFDLEAVAGGRDIGNAGVGHVGHPDLGRRR